MWLVWIGVALLAFKLAGLFGLELADSLSWWWVAAPFLVAVLWFEFAEVAFARTRATKEHDDVDRMRSERLSSQWKPKKRR